MTDEKKKSRLLERGDRFGDYTVLRLLGKGGMGVVYLMQVADGTKYAVKVMYPDKVTHESRRRFAQEAEFAMGLHHKNLISVYDVGEDPDTGLCFLIMDYVPGGSLANRLKLGRPFQVAEAVRIIEQIATGLDVAHRHGFVHRDIKPDNIIFDTDGTPKLADLGVAKFSESRQSMITHAGMIIGTPAYMAPEQMIDSHEIDARADVYSLGVVLYEMLAGKHPRAGCTALELMAKAIKGEPLPDIRSVRPELPAAIAQAVASMCATNANSRPKTALAAAELLRRAAAGRMPLRNNVLRTITMNSPFKWVKRKWDVLLIAVAGVAFAALLIVAIAVWGRVPHTPSPGNSIVPDKPVETNPPPEQPVVVPEPVMTNAHPEQPVVVLEPVETNAPTEQPVVVLEPVVTNTPPVEPVVALEPVVTNAPPVEPVVAAEPIVTNTPPEQPAVVPAPVETNALPDVAAEPVVTNAPPEQSPKQPTVQPAAQPAEPSVPPYVSKNALHKEYRSKDRKRVFVEIAHDREGDGYGSPPLTLRRVERAISDGVDIIWMKVARSRDDALFSVPYRTDYLRDFAEGTGGVIDHTAAELRGMRVKRGSSNTFYDEKLMSLEEMLLARDKEEALFKDKILFKITLNWYSTVEAPKILRALEKLLDRTHAWESVILVVENDVEWTRSKVGEGVWRKIRSGELQVMVQWSKALRKWAKVTPECSVSGRVREGDFRYDGLLKGVPQRISVDFQDWGRTDDETGWQNALGEGVTIFRTSSPADLVEFLEGKGRRQ